MIKEYKKSPEAFSLRQKAEEHLKKKYTKKSASVSEPDTIKLLHELEVHQIELEMQNEELTQARDKAKSATEKYTVLYDFAYTGYFTLDPEGKICWLNLSGAKMLGKERTLLVNKGFRQFITLDTLTDYNDFFQNVFKNNTKHTCEVRLITMGNPAIYVQIEGIVSIDEKKCLITVIDISKRKHAEEVLKQKARELEQFNELMDVSEQQMIELKKEINFLLNKLGEKEKFKIGNE